MSSTLVQESFFHSILDYQTPIDKLVTVTHLVSGNDEFLLDVNEKLPIALVIPKPNSIDKRIMDKVSSRIPISEYSRDQIKFHSVKFLEYLQRQIGNSTFAIIDVGGYFSHVLYEMKSIFGSNLVGIVEDTENGHQKYEALLSESNYRSFPCPVISVARSSLKEPEDFLIGHSIVFSAEALLREQGEILNGKNAVVLGYGKIGRSIASSLRSKDVRVNVFDINPNRQVLAVAHGFQTNEKNKIVCLVVPT